jgi:hypothetical protein
MVAPNLPPNIFSSGPALVIAFIPTVLFVVYLLVLAPTFQRTGHDLFYYICDR